MDTKQLNDALTRLFIDEGERIVFWHDPAHEFIDFMNRLPFLTFDHTTVQIIRLDEVGALETKMRLERDDPEGRFLLYAPTEEPEYEDDWLLDIRLYSRSFRADRASILLDELGLENHHLREHLAERRKFFDNKDRLQKIKALVASNDTADDLDRKMLAVVVKADQPELFTIIRTLFHAFTEVEHEDEIDLGNAPPCWDQIETFDLAQPFWRFVKHAFGYGEESPSLRNLLIRLLVTDYAHHLQGHVPPSLEHLLLPKTGQSNAVVCLAQWRDSSSRRNSYDLLSAEVARIVKIEDYVHTLEIEPFVDVMTFLEVEKAMMRGLRERVIGTADTINVEEIRDIATRRQDGHWASGNVSASPTVPRKALHAVYDTLVAAADLFDLRNHHKGGFAFDTAPAMYRAYETELFKFDQLYRHFCEAADLAESQNWDVLKMLREQVDAVYVNWYVTHQAIAWGKFVDPSGSIALLKHWTIDQVPHQHEFYQRH
ncbi:MAG: BREX-1 system phosphatase PglZ type A, partial [Candidatus Entotheonellia bacterium]